MSYIGGSFTHDLFVSYSHGTMAGGGLSPLKRWSDGFIRELVRELRTNPKYATALQIFYDDKEQSTQGLDPNAGLTEQLREAIGGSALLHVLISDQYLSSAWCRDEREWWHQRQAELGLDPQGRIAVAHVLPAAGDWPAMLADERGTPFVGHSFYDRKRDPASVRPYEWPVPTEDSRDPFREVLLDLVGWLTQRIEFLKKRGDERRAAQAEAAKLAEDSGQALYLHGREEHVETWQAARTALESQGFAVFPVDEPDKVFTDPAEAKRHQALRLELIGKCDALLLVGTGDAAAVDADLVVVGRGDRQLARARFNRYVPCGLVDTAGAPVATDARRRTAKALQVDWIDGTRPPWPNDVKAWLTQKSVQAGAR